jgi:hypothetical protein
VGDEPRPGDATSTQTADPFRGSTFDFDQLVSTATAHLEPSAPLSFLPFYAWWMSFRPRWNFSDNLRLQARFDYYKEFTNTEDTTQYREDVFGDIFTDLVYASSFARAGPWRHTKYTLGLRATWGTSLQSHLSNIYVSAGAIAGVSQTVPLMGNFAPALNAARFGLTFVYLHPFSFVTTPWNTSLNYPTQSDSGQATTSGQISGTTIVDHAIYAKADASLQITLKLDASVSALWIDQWHYPPTPATLSGPGLIMGPVPVARINDTQFTQIFWILASVDYELMDELSVGAGYYNAGNVIGLNGQLRLPFLAGEDNAFWSPEANLFLDVTVNLDRVWERARGGAKRPEVTGETTNAARSAREARLAGESPR